jgi:hypothetical protein
MPVILTAVAVNFSIGSFAAPTAPNPASSASATLAAASEADRSIVISHVTLSSN